MPPISRYRKKRTVYLGSADEAAIDLIRRRMGLRTRAGTVRFAIQNTKRRLEKSSDTPACKQLIKAVEALTLLSVGDARRLNTLCREATAEIN